MDDLTEYQRHYLKYGIQLTDAQKGLIAELGRAAGEEQEGEDGIHATGNDHLQVAQVALGQREVVGI